MGHDMEVTLVTLSISLNLSSICLLLFTTWTGMTTSSLASLPPLLHLSPSQFVPHVPEGALQKGKSDHIPLLPQISKGFSLTLENSYRSLEDLASAHLPQTLFLFQPTFPLASSHRLMEI